MVLLVRVLNEDYPCVYEEKIGFLHADSPKECVKRAKNAVTYVLERGVWLDEGIRVLIPAFGDT